MSEFESKKQKGKHAKYRRVENNVPLTKWHKSRHGALTEETNSRKKRLEKERKQNG